MEASRTVGIAMLCLRLLGEPPLRQTTNHGGSYLVEHFGSAVELALAFLDIGGGGGALDRDRSQHLLQLLDGLLGPLEQRHSCSEQLSSPKIGYQVMSPDYFDEEGQSKVNSMGKAGVFDLI